MKQNSQLTLAACCVLVLVSCHTTKPEPGYFGPTSKMYEVVRDINANNAGIPTIWSDHTFKAWVHDDKGHENYVDGDGILLFRKVADKPDELYLDGSAIVGKVFELGSSSGPNAQYWVAVMPPNKPGTEWWGYYKNLGKKCTRPIPIHPDLVAEVLGVSEIDENFLRPPVPAMRFNNDRDAYMFTFSIPTPVQWVVQKEVWYARKSKLPTVVLLFDTNGRILLRAYLSDHQPLEGAAGRLIATHYDMYFPDTKDHLEFTLKRPKLTKKGLPREGTIQRRPMGDVREIRIDEDCVD
jgi:hypothetical protein